MKNVHIRWGLYGTTVLGLFGWSVFSGDYPVAWAALLTMTSVVASQKGGWTFVMLGYVGGFFLLDLLPISTRQMLVLLAIGLTALFAYHKVVNVNRPTFWLLLMLALSLPVATFSGSAGGSGGWAEWLTSTLGLSGKTAEELIWWVRKTLHFTVYGALAWSAFRTFQLQGFQLQRIVWLAVGWSLSHALFDELKQMTIPGRTGSPSDLLIDLAGAVAAVTVAGLLPLTKP